jgi:hypothetical protein
MSPAEQVTQRLHRGQAPLAFLGIVYGVGYLLIPRGTPLARGLDLLDRPWLPLWVPALLWLAGGLLCLWARWRRDVSAWGTALVTGCLTLWGWFYLIGAAESYFHHESSRSWIAGCLHIAVAWLIVDASKYKPSANGRS